MDRDFILAQMKVTAAENGGVPLGRLRFESEAGIKEHHWTKFWARYNDLVTEAGLAPNKVTEALSAEVLLTALAGLTRSLGRFPTGRDIRARKAYDEQFPNHKVFDNTLGNKAERAAKLIAFCRANAGYEDVLAICASVSTPDPPTSSVSTSAGDGYVYLLKSGRFYKIGRAAHAGSRERQLQIQLPEPAAHVHVIRTDDPQGIEAYWHQRFAAKRKNGEWFDLDREDVSAFRRRKFM